VIYHNIEELSRDDLKWRKIAKKITKCDILADEIVSIFYLRYIKAKPDKVNSGYVNNALKNIWIRELNNNRFSEHIDNINDDEEEVYDQQKDIDNEKKYNKVIEELEKIDWFNRTLFRYVVIENIPIRKLATLSGIGYAIIQKSVVNTKKYLKNKIDNE
jgi:hypothetical protein